MNKKDLSKIVAKNTFLNQKEAVIVVEEVFRSIMEALREDGELNIVSFGKFYLYEHQPRPVRNPKTQEEMILKPYKSLRFKTSNTVKKLLKEMSYNEDV